ncbi:DUF3307 domain-containing protein [Mangrovicella endophytica]|uniref:DUF3307 domain-containing protein n=1 Tax=Mangrovicella endophytica TaxID=2066697 RepID=UPI000C9DB0D1|nr:DUF3307 domain-containing protein [Mangrovicella endophytica]
MWESAVPILLLMISGHFVCDYPLQGTFLASAKVQGPLRLWHLFGHSAIHGGAVGLITGSTVLGIAETLAHMIIDELKTRGVTSFAADQSLHMASKVIWIALLVLVPLR